MTDTQAVESTGISRLNYALLDIDSTITTMRTNGTLSDMVDLYADLDDFKNQLKIVLDDLSDLIATTMDELPETTTSNGVVIEKKNGAPRKTWQHDALGDLVARRISATAIDMDTGEVMLSPTEQIKEMLKYVGVSYWRVKALADININADQFCEVGEPKTNLIIRKAK